jgi:phytoene synthase
MHSEEFPPPPEKDLALAYALPQDRALLASLFALDDALARAVAAASEPIVGQLRLAWWRDALRASPDKRPRGNPLLDELSGHFGSVLGTLIPLVDGWEAFLLADPLDHTSIAAFTDGRAAAWQAFAEVIGEGASAAAVGAAARVWAVADLAAGLGDGPDRALVLQVAEGSRPVRHLMPRRLRSLAVLAALGQRSLDRGGAPLMAGRGSALVALRAGLFGR